MSDKSKLVNDHKEVQVQVLDGHNLTIKSWDCCSSNTNGVQRINIVLNQRLGCSVITITNNKNVCNVKNVKIWFTEPTNTTIRPTTCN